MTEQEAQTLATRLRRVWEPEQAFEILQQNQTWVVRLNLNDEVRYSCIEIATGVMHRVTNGRCFLGCFPDGNISSAYLGGPNTLSKEEKLAAQTRFDAEWLVLFRRSCWLSGCPIEASAHEKVEWIQGFSREELEAWKLTF